MATLDQNIETAQGYFLADINIGFNRYYRYDVVAPVAQSIPGVIAAEAVARAALAILQNPSRRAAMAVAARASVVPEYEVETLVARMDRLYHEIVTGLD